MKTEPADQFAAAKARAPRLGGYGESAETLLEEYAPLVRKIALDNWLGLLERTW